MCSRISIYWTIYIFIAACEIIPAMRIQTTHDAMMYLKEFGYMDEPLSYAKKMTDTKRIEMFQTFAGLRPTGLIDSKTMETMNMPRCGNKENMNSMRNGDRNSRTRRQLQGWNRSEIFYKIENLPQSAIGSKAVRKSVEKAFGLWAQVADIKFTSVDSSDPRDVQIRISFVRNDHGDGNAFGPREIGQAVAHAFYPQNDPEFAGKIHFDDDQQWVANTENNYDYIDEISGAPINFMQMCTHEIGHALGLDHSMENDSVMHMLVKREYHPDFKLHSDDIRGIQKLYGAKRRLKSKLHFPIITRPEQPISISTYQHSEEIQIILNV